MSVPIIAFFNNKGGVGKTSLVYHLAWMYADLGLKVLAADLDPQANLSAAFLDEDRLEELWPNNEDPHTVFGAIQPLLRGTGDIADPHLEPVDDGLALLAGDLLLSGFEDELSSQWPDCLSRKERAFRVISAFWRIIQKAAAARNTDLVLVDLGPNLGAINRAALIACDHVVVPLSPDLFSLQGLRNLGPKLRSWREQWQERLGKNPKTDLSLPAGEMRPLGYIVLQHSVRLDRPVKAYDRWIARIPSEYRRAVLDQDATQGVQVTNDPHCLALLKHYRSLMPMAQDARKPMFHLKPADGAIGSHFQAAQSCERDFRSLASTIARKAGIEIPDRTLPLQQATLPLA
jgi:chromosome partitioning protein